MSTPSLMERLLKGFGGAVSDVREKLVEEAWFGRRLDPSGSAHGFQQGEPGASSRGFDPVTGGLSSQPVRDPQVHFDRDTGRFSNSPGLARESFDERVQRYADLHHAGERDDHERER